MSLTVVYSLKSKVGGIECPLSIEFYRLGVGQFIGKAGAAWARRKKRRRLKSDHWSRKEPQSTRVHLEAPEDIGRVEESHHGNPEIKKKIKMF